MTDAPFAQTSDFSEQDVTRMARARTLLGWPISTLDELYELRQRAYDGDLDIEGWRAAAGQVHAAAPPLPDPEHLQQLQHAARLAWSGEEQTPQDRQLERLNRRLSAFAPPPTDEELWQQLAAPKNRALDSTVAYIRARQRQRTVRWLSRDGQTHDVTSGLPWTFLGRYRWVPVQGVGWFPASLGVARQRALNDVDDLPADDPVRVQAPLLRDEDPRRGIGGPMAEINANTVYGLAKLVFEHAGSRSRERKELVRQFEQLWLSAAMDSLLLEHTADGWPSRYARRRRPVA